LEFSFSSQLLSFKLLSILSSWIFLCLSILLSFPFQTSFYSSVFLSVFHFFFVRSSFFFVFVFLVFLSVPIFRSSFLSLSILLTSLLSILLCLSFFPFQSSFS